MWSVHTSTAMEQQSIPTVTIATEATAAMGQETAKALGFDALPIIAIPHPSDLLTEGELQTIAERIIDEIMHIWTTPVKSLEKEYSGKYSYSKMAGSPMMCQLSKRSRTV